MSPTDHRHTPAEERAIREAALDETIAETFPASDPPSTIPNPDDHDAVNSEPTITPGTPSADPAGSPSTKVPAGIRDSRGTTL